MGFDDLARNMLARQGRKVIASADGDLSTSIAEETRRLERRSNLYRGMSLVLGAFVIGIFALVLFAISPPAHGWRRNRWMRLVAMILVALIALVKGAQNIATARRA